MSRRLCTHEAEMTEAAKTGEYSNGQLEHLPTCHACRDAAMVSSWLGEVALMTERTTVVPAAEAIWWRAQVVRRLCDQEDLADRRTRPLVLAQLAAMFLVIVTAVGLLLTSESFVEGVIGSLGAFVGGTSAAVLTVAATASLLTGALVAWQAARELG